MKKIRVRGWLCLSALALFGGCAVHDDGRIVVDEHNTLGVTSLETIERMVDGDKTAVLRGFDQDDKLVATLALRIGDVLYSPEPDVMPEVRSFGSELTISVAGVNTRSVTPDLEPHVLVRLGDRSANAFVHLTPVADELERLVGISVQLPVAPSGNEATFSNGSVQQGIANEFPTGKTAYQACTMEAFGAYYGTWHATSSTTAGKIVNRTSWANGLVCRQSNGTTGCTDAGCTYGPCGFAINGNVDVPAGQYPMIFKMYDPDNNAWSCEGSWQGTAYNPPDFGTTTPTCTCTGCASNGTATPSGCTHW